MSAKIFISVGILFSLLISSGGICQENEIAATVEKVPTIDGHVKGGVHTFTGSNFNLNSSTFIEGDYYVPGTPDIRLNGQPNYLGILEGEGSTGPSGYRIYLNSGLRLGHMVTRTDPGTLPVVENPPSATGSRSVNLDYPGQDPGDWSTVRNLNMNSNAGDVYVPPGHYGRFTLNNNDGTGVILGEADAEEPLVYTFQEFRLNSVGSVRLLSPVIIYVKDRVYVNSGCVVGDPDKPDWLTLKIARYELYINSNGFVSASNVQVPSGHVYINGHLRGRVFCERLTVTSSGYLEYAGGREEENLPPVADDLNLETDEDVALSITLSGTDPEEAELTYQVLTQPEHGTLEGDAPNLTYTPSSNYYGSDSFQYLVNDGELDSEPATVSIEVKPVNDPPVAVGHHVMTDEDTPVSFELVGSDADGDELVFHLKELPRHGLLKDSTGQLIAQGPFEPSGLVYEPRVNYHGPDELAFSVEDAEEESAITRVTIEVRPVNDLPTSDDITVTILEDQKHQFSHDQFQFADVDNGSVFRGIRVVSGSGGGTLFVDADGDDSPAPGAGEDAAALPVIENISHLKFLPDPGENGSPYASYQFQVTDGADWSAASYAITINVLAVNDKPEALDDEFTTPEDTPLNLTVRASDPENAELSWHLASRPARGVLQGGGPDFVYIPEDNFHGVDQFTFYVNDGELDSEHATVTLVVEPVNDAPVAIGRANPAEGFNPLNALLDGSASYDPDGGVVSWLWTFAEEPGVELMGETVAHEFSTEGARSVTLTVTDNEGLTSQAVFQVNVLPGNSPHVLVEPGMISDTLYRGQSAGHGVMLTNLSNHNARVELNEIASGIDMGTGYAWTDSNRGTILNFEWKDISRTGVELPLAADNPEHAQPLRFPFQFFGETADLLYVRVDGTIGFEPGFAPGSAGGLEFPHEAYAAKLIAPLLAQLEPTADTRYYVEDSTGHALFQFTELRHAGTGDSMTFQVELRADGEVLFHFLEVGALTGREVTGMQNLEAADGVTARFVSAPLTAGTSVLFSSAPQWFTTPDDSMILAPGESRQVPLRLNAWMRIPLGSYNGQLLVESDQPVMSSPVEVELEVLNLPPVVRIVEPRIGQTFAGGEAIEITTLPMDEDGLVTDVSLELNGELLAASTVDNFFGYTWSETKAGIQVLQAIAVDDDGGVGVSPEVRIGVEQAAGHGDFLVNPLLLEQDFLAGEESGGTPVIPDTRFGYVWEDNYENPDLSMAWQEISETGTYLSMVSSSDDGGQTVTLSFDFPYFGQSSNLVRVVSNGFLQFGTSSGSSTYSNRSLPNSGAPDNILAFLWGDMDPSSGGEIYFQDFGDYAIIQFQEVRDFDETGYYTLQVVLRANGEMQLLYREMTGDLEQFTLGLQDGSATDGFTAVYENLYLQPGLDVRIYQVEIEDPYETKPLYLENYYQDAVSYTMEREGHLYSAGTGYYWENSESEPPVSYDWTEISSTGTFLETVTYSDDYYESVELSFDFPFYDGQYSTVYVHSNGFITVGIEPSEDDYYFTRALPSMDAPANMIAPLWRDLAPLGSGYGSYGSNYDPGEIHFQDFGDHAIIQYSLVPDNEETGTFTFQVVLWESGDIYFYYQEIDGDPDGAYIGIQNAQRDKALLVGRPLHYTIDDFSAIHIGTGDIFEEWFWLDHYNGALATGESRVGEVYFLAPENADPGQLRGSITVDHTQPGLPPYVVDVRMNIIQSEPVIDWDGMTRRYFFTGEEVPLKALAEDFDGEIEHVTFSVDAAVLAVDRNPPYQTVWVTPETADWYDLRAVATDNKDLTAETPVLSVSVSPDSDGDGLPDQYELDFFGSLASGGSGDADGDGLSDRQEWYHGTDPGDPDSYVQENVPPVAALEVDTQAGPAPLVVNFSGVNSSDVDGVVSTWLWDFGNDGHFQDLGPEPQFTFETPGIYPVTLRVLDDEGVGAEATVLIYAKAMDEIYQPVARFEVNPRSTLAGVPVALSAAGSEDPDGDIVNYTWTFEDGTSAEGVEVEKAWLTPGLKLVALTVTDNEGAEGVYSDYIQVRGEAVAPYVSPDAPVFVFDAAHSSVRWQYDGLYSWVTNAHLNPDFRDTVWVNNGRNVPFKDSAAIFYYFEITEPGFYYPAYYHVNMDASSIRVGLDGKEISHPENGQFMTAGDELQWTHGVPLGYLEAGLHRLEIRADPEQTYWLRLGKILLSRTKEFLPEQFTDQEVGLESLRQIGDELVGRPMPEFSVEVSQAGSPVEYTFDASLTQTRNSYIVDWEWHFDEVLQEQGGTVIDTEVSQRRGETVTYSYLTTGSHDVTLTVTDNYGQRASITKMIGVGDAYMEQWESVMTRIDDSLADSGFYEVGSIYCKNSPWQEDCNTRGVNLWVFGGGYIGEHYQNSNTRGGSVTYPLDPPAAGDYLVLKRMVHTSEFLNHSRDTEITVASGDDEPQISLILDQRDTWGLRALGVANLDPARDDTLRLRQGDQRAYAVADEVVLVPVAMGGVDAPTADFADTTAEADYLRRTFDASLSAAVVGREILVYLWHFGDGRVAWGRESIHTFPEAGTYEVMLTVVDSEREVGQITKSITITESDTAPPTARFTTSATSGTVPFTVEFDSGPAFAPAGISALNWDFGDGTGGEGALISHTYREKGSYLVELELVDGQGRRSYARSLIEVEPGGTSIEGAVTVDNRQARQVSLEGSWVARKTLFAWEVAPSAYPDADFFHQYTFGADAMEARTDGSRVTFTPDLPGSGLYEVYLWSQYAFIGSRGNIVPVEILGTEGITISPVNQAAWLDRWAPLGIVAHEDGSPFSLSYEMVEDGPRIFADAIKLVPYGGKSTRAKLVVSPYRGQAPLEVSLGASGSEAQAGSPSFSWDFGDGSDTLETSADTVSHVYDDAGTYHVTVTVRDAAGREASATDYVEVLPANQLPVASFTASATEGQAPLVVAFDAADSADVDGQIDRYQWVLPGGEERWGQTLVHAFTQPGVQKIILRVWDDDGEFGEASHQVTVSAPAVEPVARLNVSSPPEGSPLPWRVQLDAGGSSGGSSPITFYRFFYGSTSRTVYAPDDQLSIELDRPGIYPVTLTVTTADGRTAQTQSLLVIMEGRAFETDQVPLNITPGDAPRVNITGDWAYTEPENTWDDANTGKGDKSITFTETALETDEYLLLGHWPAGAGNATNARFVIDHAGGEDVVIADQRTTHAAGNILGIYSFQAGDPAVILLENAGTDGAVALQGVSFLKLNPSN